MKTKIEVEMETCQEVFTCPFDPDDPFTEVGSLVENSENLDDFEISIKEASKILGVSELFLKRLLMAFGEGFLNVQIDLTSIWKRMDELEKLIEKPGK